MLFLFITEYRNDTSFNKFQVFGDDTVYDTKNMSYTDKEFDQLRELFYYNVMNNLAAKG